MLIARLAAITAAASAVAAIVASGVHFAAGTAQLPARDAWSGAALAQGVAAIRAAMAPTADAPYLNPPAALTVATPGATGFELPGLALKDRFGKPAVYCAARPGVAANAALGYLADGTGYPAGDPNIVMLAFLNQDPAAAPVVDALSNPLAACQKLSTLRALPSGSAVSDASSDIDSSRSVALLRYSQLAGPLLRGASPVLSKDYVNRSPASFYSDVLLFGSPLSAAPYMPSSGSVTTYDYQGSKILVTKTDSGITTKGAPPGMPQGAGYDSLGGGVATSVQTCPADMVPVRATNLISGTQFPAHCADKYPRATASAVPLKASNTSALSEAGGIVPMTAMAAERACKLKGLVLAPAESFQALAMTASIVNGNWSSGTAGMGRFMNGVGQPDHAAGLPLAPDGASNPGLTTLGYNSALAVPDTTLATGSLAGGYPANYLASTAGANAFAVKRRHVYLSAADPTMVVYDMGLLAPTTTKVLSSRLSGLPSSVNTITGSAAEVASYGLMDLAPPALVSSAKSFATSSTAWGYATGSNVSARIYKRGLVNTYYADDRNAAAPTSTFRCVWFAADTAPN